MIIVDDRRLARNIFQVSSGLVIITNIVIFHNIDINSFGNKDKDSLPRTINLRRVFFNCWKLEKEIVGLSEHFFPNNFQIFNQ